MPRAIPLARDTADEDHGIDRHDAHADEQARRGAEHVQGDRAVGEDEERGDADRAPVSPIGEVAGGKGDADEGERFGETDEAEGERVVSEPVDLPADDDRLELRADDHREHADDEPAELAMAKRGVGIVRLDRRDVRRRSALDHERTISRAMVEW